MRQAEQALAAAREEIERMKRRIALMTVDCDEYDVDEGRCHHAEGDRLCPREPRCHDEVSPSRWTPTTGAPE